VGPPLDLSEADIALLDQSYQHAVAGLYPPVSLSPLNGDKTDAASPEVFPWVEWFRQAKDQAELLPLADLLLPTASANLLIGLDYTLLSQEQALEEFVRWSADARSAFVGGTVPPPVLEAALLLWLAPERAIHVGWRDAVNTL